MSARELPLAGELDVLLSLVPPLRLRNCPLRPAPRQEAFLRMHDKEVFFGGAAGGGKSVAILMAALRYSDVPGYDALILRPSLAELQLAGGLIELAHDWLGTTKARWSGDTKTWKFPGSGRSGAGGAMLTFGYLADASDVARYSGTSYSFVGFDELTRFEEANYRRMFRVLRQPVGTTGFPAAPDGTTLAGVPPRIRSTSNPGGPGHAWVKERFVDPKTRHAGAVYLPSRITDNPHLDTETYLETLTQLPSAERERLIHGDWDVPDDGELFKRDWFVLIERHQLPEKGLRAVRYWDLAATAPSAANRDPDWTVGLRLEWHRGSGEYFITDIVRERRGPGAIEELVKETATRDGREVSILIEQEPGAAGVHAVERYKRHVLPGYATRADHVSGDKLTRATPVAASAENGYIKVVRGRHTQAFLDELSAFPHGRHDDCVDALSGAFKAVTQYGGPGSISFTKARKPRPVGLPGGGSANAPRDIEGERLAALLGATFYPAPPNRLRGVRRRGKRSSDASGKPTPES